MRKLKFISNVFNIDKKPMQNILPTKGNRYGLTRVESLVTDCVVCSHKNIQLHSKRLLSNILNVCSKIVDLQ